MTREKRYINPLKTPVNVKADEVLLTVSEVAQILAIDQSTVYKWVDQGRIPYIDLGAGKKRVLRFRREDIQKLIEENLVDKKELLR